MVFMGQLSILNRVSVEMSLKGPFIVWGEPGSALPLLKVVPSSPWSLRGELISWLTLSTLSLHSALYWPNPLSPSCFHPWLQQT